MWIPVLYDVIRKGLSDSVTFEQVAEQHEGVNLWLLRARAFQIAGTASAKVLR